MVEPADFVSASATCSIQIASKNYDPKKIRMLSWQITIIYPNITPFFCCFCWEKSSHFGTSSDWHQKSALLPDEVCMLQRRSWHPQFDPNDWSVHGLRPLGKLGTFPSKQGCVSVGCVRLACFFVGCLMFFCSKVTLNSCLKNPNQQDPFQTMAFTRHGLFDAEGLLESESNLLLGNQGLNDQGRD